MKYSLILFATFLIWSCTAKKDHYAELITSVKRCIDSGEIKEELVQVIESDYEDFILYYINGSYEASLTCSIDSILIPSRIMEYKKKKILFFEPDNVRRKIDSVLISEDSLVYTGFSNVNWFYIVNKKTKVGFLIRNEDKETSPYDVSIIRDLIMKRAIDDTISVDIVATDIVFDCTEKQSCLSSTKAEYYLPFKLQANFTVYDRANSCHSFCPQLPLLGEFVLLHNSDTLIIKTTIDNDRQYTKYKADKRLNLKELISDKYYSYNKNWDICGYYCGQSENDSSFFNNIHKNHLRLDLYKILKDSFYYIPNQDAYKKYADTTCNYPQKRIKIFFSTDNFYKFKTPFKTYIYKKGQLIRSDE